MALVVELIEYSLIVFINNKLFLGPIIASESGKPLAISSNQHRRKRRSSVSPYRKIREQTPLSHPSPSNTGSPIASLSSFTSQGRKSFSLLEFD